MVTVLYVLYRPLLSSSLIRTQFALAIIHFSLEAHGGHDLQRPLPPYTSLTVTGFFNLPMLNSS